MRRAFSPTGKALIRVGLALCIALVGTVFVIVPIAQCIGCLGLGALTWKEVLIAEGARSVLLQRANPELAPDAEVIACRFCNGTGRLPILRRVYNIPPTEILLFQDSGVPLIIREDQLRLVKSDREKNQ